MALSAGTMAELWDGYYKELSKQGASLPSHPAATFQGVLARHLAADATVTMMSQDGAPPAAGDDHLDGE